MKRIILTSIIAIMLGYHADAQERSDSALIYFRQSEWEVETGYKDNGRRLDDMMRFLDTVSSPMTGYRLRYVRVSGGASPEGSVEINRRLSEQRAQSIFRYMGRGASLADSLTRFTFLGRDWQGLYNMVAADAEMPYRDDVLALIAGIMADGATEENSVAQLKTLHGGEPYSYMYRNMFPDLRASKIWVEYSRPLDPIALTTVPGVETVEPAMPGCDMALTYVKKEEKPFYMALKTNMLYDLLAVPNVSAEFYLGRNWSVVGNWMYGWWKDDNVHRYWRIYGGDVALRRWFGHKAYEKPLTGHHVGVYAGVVTYDFEFGGTGYMGGLPGRTLWDRCNFTAGVEYGYSLPIARRLNIDFTIGLGYLGGRYVRYVPDDGCYVWQATRNLCWFGPTKAEVSLVWLIGHGNYNSRKGGKR